MWLAGRSGQRRCHHCAGQLPDRGVPCARACPAAYCSDSCRSAAVAQYHGPLCGAGSAAVERWAHAGTKDAWDGLALALVWKMLGNAVLYAGGRDRPLRAPPADAPPFSYLQRARSGAASSGFCAAAVGEVFRAALGPPLASEAALGGPGWLTDAWSVVTTNAAVVSLAPGDEVLALAPRTALFNHNCAPNARARWGGLSSGAPPHVTVVASRLVPAGAELTMAYIDTRLGLLDRARGLRRRFAFECRCSRCVEEERWCADTDRVALAQLRLSHEA